MNRIDQHLICISAGYEYGMTRFAKTNAPATFAQVLTARTPEPILPGDSPPGWQLTDRLGGGTYCDVYRARPEHCPGKQPADFAVKLAKQPSTVAVELLRNEAKAMHACRSHHVVPLLAASFADETPFIVMPYLPGLTLAEQISSTSRPALPFTLWLARQLAVGLQELAAVGWMHGDVKPANAILSSNGHVTLIDLGFAAPIGLANAASTQRQPLAGTPHYLAPERLIAGEPPTAASDVYGLGVVLFELLTGQLPYRAASSTELVDQLQTQKIPDVRAINPQVPLRLARLLRGMLASVPQRRPTAGEVAAQLASLEIELFAERLSGVPAAGPDTSNLPASPLARSARQGLRSIDLAPTLSR